MNVIESSRLVFTQTEISTRIVALTFFSIRNLKSDCVCNNIGPLHGIPYGLKDIIAVPHYKTTWGSRTYENQILDIEAWVYKRFEFAI